MVGTILATGATLASAAYGAIQSADYNRRAQKLISNQRTDNKRWYNTRMNEDYTNRTDAQAVINKQNEILQQNLKRSRATNAVAGGTAEQQALQQASANNSLAQTMADISAQGASYKNHVEETYRQNDAALNQQQAQTLSNQAQATAQAASQAVNAGLNVIGNNIALKKTQDN